MQEDLNYLVGKTKTQIKADLDRQRSLLEGLEEQLNKERAAKEEELAAAKKDAAEARQLILEQSSLSQEMQQQALDTAQQRFNQQLQQQELEIQQKNKISHTIAHEIAHALSPYPTKENNIIGSTLLYEGIAEKFREFFLRGEKSPWTKAISPKKANKILKRLNLKEDSYKLYRELFFGSERFVPVKACSKILVGSSIFVVFADKIFFW